MRSCVQICVWCLKSRLFWYNQLTCVYLTEKLCDYWISLITLTYWKGRTRASTKPEMNITMQKTKSTPWYEVTSNCKEESTSNQTYVSQHVGKGDSGKLDSQVHGKKSISVFSPWFES